MFNFDDLVMRSADELNAAPSAAPSAAPDLEVEVVGGIACPIDPMERLGCDSCQ